MKEEDKVIGWKIQYKIKSNDIKIKYIKTDTKLVQFLKTKIEIENLNDYKLFAIHESNETEYHGTIAELAITQLVETLEELLDHKEIEEMLENKEKMC